MWQTRFYSLRQPLVLDSTLKKKSQSIAYHFVREEGAARDKWRNVYVNTHDNPADLLTTPYWPLVKSDQVLYEWYYIIYLEQRIRHIGRTTDGQVSFNISCRRPVIDFLIGLFLVLIFLSNILEQSS